MHFLLTLQLLLKNLRESVVLSLIHLMLPDQKTEETNTEVKAVKYKKEATFGDLSGKAKTFSSHLHQRKFHKELSAFL